MQKQLSTTTFISRRQSIIRFTLNCKNRCFYNKHRRSNIFWPFSSRFISSRFIKYVVRDRLNLKTILVSFPTTETRRWDDNRPPVPVLQPQWRSPIWESKFSSTNLFTNLTRADVLLPPSSVWKDGNNMVVTFGHKTNLVVDSRFRLILEARVFELWWTVGLICRLESLCQHRKRSRLK